MNVVAFNAILLDILPINLAVDLAVRGWAIGQALWGIVRDLQLCVARHVIDKGLGLEKATACHINRGDLLSTLGC